VRYLELRTTPREVRNEHGEVTISKEEYVLIVLKAIEEFKQQQQHTKMSVYLILSIDRGRDTAASAEEVVDIAIKHRNHNHDSNNPQPSPVIVGIDLCGNPTKGNVSIYRTAFNKARAAGLKTTLHFAETIYSTSNSSEELETLLSFSPDRLGHVIHVPDPIKQKIAARKIALELCLSCNVHAKLIQGGIEDHHFGYWWNETECAVILCVSYIPPSPFSYF
jgi:adenosine deaminase